MIFNAQGQVMPSIPRELFEEKSRKELTCQLYSHSLKGYVDFLRGYRGYTIGMQFLMDDHRLRSNLKLRLQVQFWEDLHIVKHPVPYLSDFRPNFLPEGLAACKHLLEWSRLEYLFLHIQLLRH